MIRLLALGIIYLLSGCVSIKTHEQGKLRAKIEAYEDCIGIIERYSSRSSQHLLKAKIRTLEQEDLIFLIDGRIDVEKMKQ